MSIHAEIEGEVHRDSLAAARRKRIVDMSHFSADPTSNSAADIPATFPNPGTEAQREATSPAHVSQGTKERVGAWVRLPCCNHTVHPIEIISQSDGVMVISRPTQPHEEWVSFPDPSSTLAVGWSDEEGTLGFFCTAVGKTDDGHWALQIINANDFAQRRRHVRVKTTATAELIDPTRLRPVEVSVLDISESGMKCEFVDFVPNQQDLPYRFVVKFEGVSLLLLGDYRWSAKVNPVTYHAAFEFTRIHEDELRRLRAHIMQQLSLAQRA